MTFGKIYVGMSEAEKVAVLAFGKEKCRVRSPREEMLKTEVQFSILR